MLPKVEFLPGHEVHFKEIRVEQIVIALVI